MATGQVRYRYRLRVGAKEAAALGAADDACRIVGNRALGDWGERWKAERHQVSYTEASKTLTARRKEFDWLRAQPQNPQEQVLWDLYRSIGAFFDKSNPAGRPRFKSKKQGYATARWTKHGFSVSGTGRGQAGDRLEVAVAGGRIGLRVLWSRLLPSSPTSVTAHQDPAGRWWASFVVQVGVVEGPLHPDGPATGLDVGRMRFSTTEDPDTNIENPRYARRAAKAFAQSQRNMAAKRRGSKKRATAKVRVARVSAAVADQRRDFHHKAARPLVGAYDRIGVEDLRIKSMSAKGAGRHTFGLNRSIADAGWGQFLAILSWQAKKAGKEVVVLPAKDTTQTCSSCGTKAKPRMELSDRVFCCRVCGLVLDRDRNAARNLHPVRLKPDGEAEPSGVVPAGSDGSKPRVPAGALAA